jgi:hypothetical protein
MQIWYRAFDGARCLAARLTAPFLALIQSAWQSRVHSARR